MKRIKQVKKAFSWIEFLKRNKYIVEIGGDLKL